MFIPPSEMYGIILPVQGQVNKVPESYLIESIVNTYINNLKEVEAIVLSPVKRRKMTIDFLLKEGVCVAYYYVYKTKGSYNTYTLLKIET